MPIDQAGPASSNPRRLPRPKKKQKVTKKQPKAPFPELGNNYYGAPNAVKNSRHPNRPQPKPTKTKTGGLGGIVSGLAGLFGGGYNQDDFFKDFPKYTGSLAGKRSDRDPLAKFGAPARPKTRNVSSPTKPNYNNVPAVRIPGTDAGGRIGGVTNRGGGGSRPDGTMSMLDALIQHTLSESSSSSFDYEHALQQSQRAIRRAYGAEINAVRSNNTAATRETRRDRKQLEAMYDGLARSYGQAAHQAQVNANQGARAQTALANEANKTIKANQGSNTKEEANLLKGLGLQAAAKDIIDPDFKEVTKVEAENTATGARKAAVQKEFGGINRDFMLQGGLSSRMEGTNRSADLLTNLEDYIRQNRNQIAILAGKRGQDLVANRQATQSAAAQAQATSNQNQTDNLLKEFALRAQMGDTNVDNALAAAKFQFDQGVAQQNFGLKASGQRFDQQAEKERLTQGREKINISLNAAANKKQNSYLPKEIQASMGIIKSDGQKQGKLTDIMQALFNSQPYRDGSTTRHEGKGIDQKNVHHKLTGAEAANMAERAARNAGLSPHDIQVARLAAWASVK